MSLEHDARRVLDAAEREDERAIRYLSPSACARLLDVSASFVRGEVKDGRLQARVLTRPSGRSVYRIAEAAFQAYVERYWPEHGSTGNMSAHSA